MATGGPDCSNQQEYTVLMRAASGGSADGVRLLLDSGAHINTRSDKV